MYFGAFICGLFMRDRSAVVIVESNKVLLIKRTRKKAVYYVFPGGGIEQGETPEAAAEREALEELGLKVKVRTKFAEVLFNGTQHYFIADILAGILGSGQGEEYTDKGTDRGTYTPVWVGIEKLCTLDVRPQEIAIQIKTCWEEK